MCTLSEAYHEPVTFTETFFIEAERAPVIAEETDFPPVLGHDNENFIFLWLSVQLLVIVPVHTYSAYHENSSDSRICSFL